MFINAHLRLPIPGILGPVITTPNPAGYSVPPLFSMFEDPATYVPDIIAFQNDSDTAVTLHFDSSNWKAQVYATVASPFNVTSSNLNLLIQVDGETPVAIALATGGSQTAAQVAANINTAFAAAGGNTSLAVAQAVVVSSNTVVRITSGTQGELSQVNIQTPASNSANALLGFTVGSSTADSSYILDIVSPITINAKGMGTFINPRRGAPILAMRGVTATGVPAVIDATTLYRHSGVQQ